jgi:MOSC domain-containing protein YiiM
MSARLAHLFVGRPARIDDIKPWTSGIIKHEVFGPVSLRVVNLDGDEQADLRLHGGRDKAVCVYATEHYDDWRREVGVAECGPGWFGENFSLAGQTEWTVALGDTYRIGTAIVQVSQPRGPCSKLARRWGLPDFPKRVVASLKSGWYVRVLEEGVVIAGDELVLQDRPFPHWTIAHVNTLTYARGKEAKRLHDERMVLANCPVLAASWREDILSVS